MQQLIQPQIPHPTQPLTQLPIQQLILPQIPVQIQQIQHVETE